MNLIGRFIDDCVYCGYDADAVGDDMAAQMIAVHPGIKRLRPSHHDWNDALRAATWAT